jgi:hypothetical protein
MACRGDVIFDRVLCGACNISVAKNPYFIECFLIGCKTRTKSRQIIFHRIAASSLRRVLSSRRAERARYTHFLKSNTVFFVVL